MISTANPGIFGKQNQNGEDFQPACQHGQGQGQLGQGAELGEIAGGANLLQTGTNVIQRCYYSRKIRYKTMSLKR